MEKSVEGIYRNGKVELLEPLAGAEGSRVIITLVRPAEPVDLRERGIDESQASDRRAAVRQHLSMCMRRAESRYVVARFMAPDPVASA